jgi:DNA-binding PadR family transcriptional regulator
MEIDALRIALLAVCSSEDALLHRIHGELEHWLSRQLATAEVEAALADLAGQGLVAVRGEAAPPAYATTDSGRALVAERWEEFFPE